MKFKKWTIGFVAAAVVAVSLFTGCGCKTGSGNTSVIGTDTNGLLFVLGNPVSTNQFAATMKLTGVAAATIAGHSDTNSIAYLQAVATGIEDLVGSGSTDPNAVQNIANAFTTGVDPSVIAGVNAGVAAYQTFLGYALDQKLSNWSLYAVPGLTSFAQGILTIYPTSK